KCKTLHLYLPMTANDLPIRSSDASFVARCVQIRVSSKKVSKSRQKMRTLMHIVVSWAGIAARLCPRQKARKIGPSWPKRAAVGGAKRDLPRPVGNLVTACWRGVSPQDLGATR